MKYNIITVLFFLSCTFLNGACSDDDAIIYNEDGVHMGEPEAVINNADFTDVTIKSMISLREGVRYVHAGYCYSTEDNPTIYKNTVDGLISAEDSLNLSITGLKQYQTYYVRAFVSVYNGKTVYSNSIKIYTGKTEAELAAYKAPEYPDNYTSIAGWDQRSKWNLANVHDPSVMKAADGYYYMYQTDASYGNSHDGHGHFHARRSKDLVNWEYLGSTMDEAPAWVKTKMNEYRTAAGLAAIDNPIYGYWAPVARKVSDNLYRMYYSIVVTNNIDGNNSWSERAFIGMAETTDPSTNKWEDKGFVTCSASDKGTNWSRPDGDWNAYFRWNAIDPSYIITPGGEHWLIYGSWHSGIVSMKLDAASGLPANELGKPWADNADGIANYGQLIATRNMSSRWQGSEGPEIVYNAETGYYYLFLAYDALGVPYNTRVVRSKSINGPYLGIDGTDVTNTGGEAFPIVTHPYKFNNSDGWVGISHCAVFEDGHGNWFYSSQARFPENVAGINASNAIMLGHVRSIRWTKDGWPLVMPERFGDVPQTIITEAELIGNWENINLTYNYGKQDTSVSITLGEDHKVKGGDWEGKVWSFNAENKTLTIDGIELYLQRECDWEASPRTHTIVYAGYNGTKTFWGKKSK